MSAPIRRADLNRIAHTGMRAGHHLEQHGVTVFNTTRDWATPLTANTTGPGGKGGHSDPTGEAALDPDLLINQHTQLQDAIAAYQKASDQLYLLLEANRPLTEEEDKAKKARKQKLAYCIVCDIEVLEPRRGMCETHYRRWVRAGQPANAARGMRRQHLRETGQLDDDTLTA